MAPCWGTAPGSVLGTLTQPSQGFEAFAVKKEVELCVQTQMKWLETAEGTLWSPASCGSPKHCQE